MWQQKTITKNQSANKTNVVDETSDTEKINLVINPRKPINSTDLKLDKIEEKLSRMLKNSKNISRILENNELLNLNENKILSNNIINDVQVNDENFLEKNQQNPIPEKKKEENIEEESVSEKTKKNEKMSKQDDSLVNEQISVIANLSVNRMNVVLTQKKWLVVAARIVDKKNGVKKFIDEPDNALILVEGLNTKGHVFYLYQFSKKNSSFINPTAMQPQISIKKITIANKIAKTLKKNEKEFRITQEIYDGNFDKLSPEPIDKIFSSFSPQLYLKKIDKLINNLLLNGLNIACEFYLVDNTKGLHLWNNISNAVDRPPIYYSSPTNIIDKIRNIFSSYSIPEDDNVFTSNTWMRSMLNTVGISKEDLCKENSGTNKNMFFENSMVKDKQKNNELKFYKNQVI